MRGLKRTLLSRTQTAAESTNLNANDAVSNFGVYQIDINGSIYKIGKADLVRITKSSGLPTRIHQQVRKLIKLFGTGNVNVANITDLGQVTTASAKAAEQAAISQSFQTTGFIPIGNWKSFSL